MNYNYIFNIIIIYFLEKTVLFHKKLQYKNNLLIYIMSHICLLFLTYSNIIHINEFTNLFGNCNVYIHPKYPEKMNESLKNM